VFPAVTFGPVELRLVKSLRADLLIFADFGLEPLDASARHDLLEILEER
jgi:DNA replication protein DnaC